MVASHYPEYTICIMKLLSCYENVFFQQVQAVHVDGKINEAKSWKQKQKTCLKCQNT